MAAAFFTFYLWIVNATGFMPRCPVKWATGWNCPGCGSQRAFMALLHGHPMAAFRANLILPLAMAYLAVMLFLLNKAAVGWLCLANFAMPKRFNLWNTLKS